jgi:hypothetical protein
MPSRRAARTRLLAAALSLAAACASGRGSRPARDGTLAAGWERHRFEVPRHGALLLAIPPGWTATQGTEGEDGAAGVAAVRLESPGREFAALLTPLWNPGEPEGAEARAHAALLFAEMGRRTALAGSVEREIPLQELRGGGDGDVTGFWFAATDRALLGREPGPDEWRHVLQGAAAVGPVILAFTLLDNGPGPHRAHLLDVVRSARHEGGDEQEETAEIDPVPGARTLPLRVAAPGKSWSVLVDLPGFRIGVRRAAQGRAALVLGIDPQTDLVASITVRAAGSAKDAAACRDADMSALSLARPDVAGLRVAAGDPAARAWYTVPAGADGPAQTNAHAFLHRDGLCANVHVSKIQPDAGDAARIEAILSSVRFGEDL